MKKIKDDTKKWKDILFYCFGKINIVKMFILPKAIQIYCNPYQNIHDTFHRTRMNNPKIYMEPENTPNCQSKLKKKRIKLEVSHSLTSDYTTKPQ